MDISLSQVLRHDSLYWSCISAVEQRDGWLLFHNRGLVPRIDPNHAGEFRAGDRQSKRIVQEIIDFYRALGAVPAAYVDALATPDDLIPTLLQAGFQEWTGALSDLMVYRGPDMALPTTHIVERVTTPRARKDWASITGLEGREDEEAQDVLQQLYVTQIADPRIEAYLIRVDGAPASRCLLFTSEGLGRVEAVRTEARFRRQGLAAAGVRHAVGESLKKNHLTYLYVEPGADAQRLYHRLGFRQIVQNAIRGFVWQGHHQD